MKFDKLEKIVEASTSLEEVFIGLGYSRNPNAGTRRKVAKALQEICGIGAPAQFFREKRFPKSKIKLCPVCNKEFKPKKDSITCGYACSNKYFRSGLNNGNFKGTDYTTICFFFHKKECVVCGENKIVSVHHYDENHNNNIPENLVPLCPTHHMYMHSNFKNEIFYIVEQYIKDFKESPT